MVERLRSLVWFLARYTPKRANQTSCLCVERSDTCYCKTSMPAKRRDVYVCHAGSCLARGAEGVLTEIEELVKACHLSDSDDAIRVRESGCLGYCSQAPNAAVVDRGSRELNSSDVHRRIDSLEASANVARRATGVNLRLEDPELITRCEGLRERRARMRAAEETKWNAALRGLAVTEGPLTYTCVAPGSGKRAGIDRDLDDVLDALDNCPGHKNLDQADADSDGLGDACDPEPTLVPEPGLGLGLGVGGTSLLALAARRKEVFSRGISRRPAPRVSSGSF